MLHFFVNKENVRLGYEDLYKMILSEVFRLLDENLAFYLRIYEYCIVMGYMLLFKHFHCI